MKQLLIAILASLLLSACSSTTISTIDINKKLCQRYSKEYRITTCNNNLSKIWLKTQNDGDGYTIVNLSDFSETNCPVIADNLLDKKCLEKLQCSPVTCN